MSVSYGGDSITFADGSVTSSGWTGFKNRIINGSMRINQREGGAGANTANNGAAYCLDRWQIEDSTDGVFTGTQSTDVPTGQGFTNSLKITVTTTDTSIASNQYATFTQHIEGNHIADLNWGTASASAITISFWVKSSVTGTYTCMLRNFDGSRMYVQGFAINSSNTWEYKTIVIPGDVTGTWLTTNSRGISLQIMLAHGGTTGSGWSAGVAAVVSGQVNFMATVNNELYITGVQLEKGSTASSFEHRSYVTELNLCHRYYERYSGQYTQLGMGRGNSSTSVTAWFFWKVKKRTSPSLNISSGSDFRASDAGANRTSSNLEIGVYGSQSDIAQLNMTASSLTSGSTYSLDIGTSTGWFAADAEL
jgi:hypothetical protein